MKKSLLLLLLFSWSTSLYSQITFQEHEVTSFTYSARENKMADIDNDGDLDIVTVGSTDIHLYENRFPEEGFMTKQIVAEFPGSYGLQGIDVSDFDGDGDLDILGTNLYDDKLFMVPNIDGQGTFGAVQILKTLDQVRFVKHIDMDNDGDKDLLYECFGNNGQSIGYYENTNQPNNYTILHIINNESMNVIHNIQVADLDNDGYPDIFYRFLTFLGWIKNNGAVSFSPLTVISTQTAEYYSYDIGDIDNDGDFDLVGYIDDNVGNKILLYKLNDGLGNFGADQIIRQNLTEIKAIKLADIDNDSKLDLIVAIRNANSSEYYSDLIWYKNAGLNGFTNMPVLDLKVRMISEISTFDLNNDGKNDIITCSHSNRTTTYQNNGSGTFGAAKYPAAASMQASSVVAGDVDGDGDIDVVTTSKDDGKIYWYKNTDNIYGNQIVVNHNVAAAKKAQLADIDGDDDLDIICISGPSTSGATDKLSIYKNLDGLGTFGPQINLFPTGGTYDSPDGLAVYDVDGDGDKDIVTALDNWPDDGDKIVWYANNGTGTFSTEQQIGTGVDGVRALKTGDIDGDGDLDLVCASFIDNKICWFPNNGSGNFGTQSIITTNALYVTDVEIADLNSDGKNDVVYVSNGSADDVLWQPNLGLGVFGPAQVINSNVDGNGAATLAAADIDNDSDIDIFVGEATKITWSENLYGQANFEPPKIISSTVGSGTGSQIIDADNDGDLDFLISSGTNKVFWFKNQGVNQNTIKGTVRLDIEGNGCGENDSKLPNIIVSTTDGTNTHATLTFRNEYAGQYRLYVGEGNFETSVVTNLPNYFMLNPTSHNSSFVGFGNIDTADFCIEPTAQVNDLYVTLYSLEDTRPGFNTSYQLVYKNVGTTTLTGQVALQYENAKLQFLNADSAPSSTTANTLTFSFTDLDPLQTRNVLLKFNVFTPPTTNINDILVFNSTISPVADDITPQDNTHILNQLVIGSYDPNDITCIEGPAVLIDDVDKYLHYVIRFQNTGTASAINVKVNHTLDSQLDWTTLQLEAMSHNGRTTITDGSLVEFMFNNIRLPYSAANEAGSHGFIAFKIKPKTATIDLGDTVNATAAIYFDFNPPIITNTASTTYVDALSVDSFDRDLLIVYPNPAKDQLMIKSLDGILQVDIYTILGAKVLEVKNKDLIDISSVESGVYMISIKTDKGSYFRKIIKE